MKSEISLYHFASTINFVKTSLSIIIDFFENPLKIGETFLSVNSLTSTFNSYFIRRSNL